jgi:hypothetical protein
MHDAERAALRGLGLIPCDPSPAYIRQRIADADDEAQYAALVNDSARSPAAARMAFALRRALGRAERRAALESPAPDRMVWA